MRENSDSEPPDQNKRLWQEIVAGFGAGFVNVAVTYPLHKGVFRQMVHDVSAVNAFNQLRREGIGLLYRGLLPPLCQRSLSSAQMFAGYDFYTERLLFYFPSLHSQVAKSSAAAFAGVTEGLLMIPFERIQVLLQDKNHNKKLKNSYHAVTHIWRRHGVKEFYRGGSTILLMKSTSNVVFFAAKEKSQQLLPTGNSSWAKFVSDFVSGALIGAAISSAYFPINLVKSRMQMELGGPFQSPLKVFQVVFNERDRVVTKMFTGVHLNYTRSFVSWGVTNAAYELIKPYLHRLSDTSKHR